EAEDLESSGVGEDGAVPGHEAVQAAHLSDCADSGPQIQMISIAENDLRAEFFEGVLGNGFDSSDSAHRHEDRALNFRMRRENAPGASFAGGLFHAEFKRHASN